MGQNSTNLGIGCLYYVRVPDHAMVIAYDKKMRNAEELCRMENIAFIAVVAESLGRLNPVAVEQLRSLGRALSLSWGGGGYCPPHLKDLPDPHEEAGLPRAQQDP